MLVYSGDLDSAGNKCGSARPGTAAQYTDTTTGAAVIGRQPLLLARRKDLGMGEDKRAVVSPIRAMLQRLAKQSGPMLLSAGPQRAMVGAGIVHFGGIARFEQAGRLNRMPRRDAAAAGPCRASESARAYRCCPPVPCSTGCQPAAAVRSFAPAHQGHKLPPPCPPTCLSAPQARGLRMPMSERRRSSHRCGNQRSSGIRAAGRACGAPASCTFRACRRHITFAHCLPLSPVNLPGQNGNAR